jgi:hypothetical protein
MSGASNRYMSLAEFAGPSQSPALPGFGGHAFLGGSAAGAGGAGSSTDATQALGEAAGWLIQCQVPVTETAQNFSPMNGVPVAGAQGTWTAQTTNSGVAYTSARVDLPVNVMPLGPVPPKNITLLPDVTPTPAAYYSGIKFVPGHTYATDVIVEVWTDVPLPAGLIDPSTPISITLSINMRNYNFNSIVYQTLPTTVGHLVAPSRWLRSTVSCTSTYAVPPGTEDNIQFLDVAIVGLGKVTPPALALNVAVARQRVYQISP